MNHQPLILTCDCGYRTPPHGRNGKPLTEGIARRAFRHHRCVKARDARIDVACPDCGETRSILKRADRGGRVCRRCAQRALAAEYTARQADVDEVAIQRLLSGAPVRSTRAERQAAVAYLTQHGASADAISRRTRMSERTVVRLRRRRTG